ncbi:hypothetical protein HFO56_39545 [Rhizobium laguerreae]|uniref:hypothetical protein n=1 Tax=Rhizobium laguerreae TaxID=1076926 RepID=UPI001C8FFDDC|nr:hypothetical protein [Rhizobium laguerreae]MBY3158396.1 hypothetical protein [Rhizobium laguerreae]
MRDFAPEGIKNTAETAEGRVFAACLELARKGKPNWFALAVDELVTVPYVPTDGSSPRLITKRLCFEVPIWVRADDHLALHEKKLEHGGDGSSAYTDVRDIWVNGDNAWERTEQYYKAHKDPMSYLRLLAVQWAGRALEAALRNSDPDRAFDGVPDEVRNSLWTIAFQVAADGAVMTKSLNAVPLVGIEPSAIWGAKTFLSLGAVDGALRLDDWKGHLLTFQLGDLIEAQATRDALVVGHCPQYDDTYGYDWMDLEVRSVLGRDRTLETIRKDEPESATIKGLRALGVALKAAGLMDQDDKADFEVAYYEGGPYQKLFREVIEAISQKRPRDLQGFLDANGWLYDFSPLQIADIREGLRSTHTQANQPKP